MRQRSGEKRAQEGGFAFMTFPGDGFAGPLTFGLGSCHYPLFESGDGSVFDSMEGPKKEGGHTFMLHVGDQIYGDPLRGIAKATDFEQFAGRYIDKYAHPSVCRALASFANFMILDDHELEDNWTSARLTNAAATRLYDGAMRAYNLYQYALVAEPSSSRFGGPFDFSFHFGRYPFFVMDVRSQRVSASAGRAGSCFDEDQFARLSSFLDHAATLPAWIPKFIVSSSLFFPFPTSDIKETWSGYPESRARFLAAVTSRGVDNVVVLTGDIHCSLAARALLHSTAATGPSPLSLFSIISSPIHWPYRFLAHGVPSDHVPSGSIRTRDFFFEYAIATRPNSTEPSGTSKNNYARISVQPPEPHRPAQLSVEWIGIDRVILDTHVYPLSSEF